MKIRTPKMVEIEWFDSTLYNYGLAEYGKNQFCMHNQAPKNSLILVTSYPMLKDSSRQFLAL